MATIHQFILHLPSHVSWRYFNPLLLYFIIKQNDVLVSFVRFKSKLGGLNLVNGKIELGFGENDWIWEEIDPSKTEIWSANGSRTSFKTVNFHCFIVRFWWCYNNWFLVITCFVVSFMITCDQFACDHVVNFRILLKWPCDITAAFNTCKISWISMKKKINEILMKFHRFSSNFTEFPRQMMFNLCEHEI